ncbi:MAG TPA: glucokinase [Terriglobales bacterium]|nr:glucokinase [Terriglobales bacterium]
MMILAGDIGATHSRVAAFKAEGNKFPLVVEKIYDSQDYSGLDQIAGEFIRVEGIPAQTACFAVAGPVRAGKSKISNLPWTIDSHELARQLKLKNVGLINDLEAYAYGLDSLESKDFITLHPGAEDAEGNTAVISAGTGLGEAGLLWDGFRQHPFACEGGHTDFAPRSEIQIELLKYLLTHYKTVSYERVLAGPGIKNVYDFLRDTKRVEEPAWLREQIAAAKDPPALISQMALENKVPICEQTMSIFVSVYGAEAGNCALKFMSLGGMFIGGSIAAKNIPLMKRPEFLEAFFDKGRMRSLLEDIPVKIVLNDDAGLLGAARYACIQKAFGAAQWA